MNSKEIAGRVLIAAELATAAFSVTPPAYAEAPWYVDPEKVLQLESYQNNMGNLLKEIDDVQRFEVYQRLSDETILAFQEGYPIDLAREFCSGFSSKVLAPGATGTFNWPTEGGIWSYFNNYHRGLDIGNLQETEIRAADGGIVVSQQYIRYGYGFHLILAHGMRRFTLYAHNSSMRVSVGDQVEQGDIIARMGSTGMSTGPHLHFEVFENCQPINPLNVLPR